MSETEPLLPTHNKDINAAQPSKATAQKIAAAYAALKQGKMPTNSQLHHALLRLSNSNVLDSSSIGRTNAFSAEGSLVVEDLKALLDDIIKFGGEKNADNKFQRFIYHTREAADLDVDVPEASLPVGSREAKRDANAALSSLRTLGNLLITSPEFRRILSEITFVSRDLFADAASALADKAKDAAEAARPTEEERREGVDVDKLKRKGKEVRKKLRTGRYEADYQDALASTREWLVEQQPDANGAKDTIIERLKRVVVSVQKNSEYHGAINTLVDLVKKYVNKTAEAAENVKDNTDIQADDDAQKAAQLLRELIEALANGKSLDDVYRAFDRVIKDIKSDDRLSSYFDDLAAYINKLLHAEGYVFSQNASRKADELIDRAQSLLENNANWKADYRNLVDELRAYQQAIEDDKTIAQLTRHLAYLKNDLADFGIAGAGLFSAKAIGLYKDLYDVVLPRVISSIKQIPLPRIEYVSEELDFAIDEFVIESVSFIPDRMQFVNHNNLLFEQGYAAFASNFDSSTRLRVQGLRFSASDIAYYINSKTGWGWEDAGLLAISLEEGGGLNFDVKLELAGDEDKESFFKVAHVNVDIVNFNYTVSRSDHWLLNSFLKPFARPYIHDAIKQTLEHQIKSALEDADKRLFALQQRAIAASSAQPTLAGYFRAIFAPTSIFPSASASARPSKKGVIVTGAHGEYRLAIGVDEQLLPGRGGPSADYERRKELIEQAKTQASRALGSGRSLAGQLSSGAQGVVNEIGKAHADIKRAQREEESQTGWRSKAFDL